jgi:sugar phosphate isomerase/epimerase
MSTFCGVSWPPAALAVVRNGRCRIGRLNEAGKGGPMFDELTRREWMEMAVAAMGAVAGLAKWALAEEAAPAVPAKAPPWPFYAMDTGLGGPDVPAIEAKVKLLAKLGYTGVDYSLNHQQLPKWIEELDKNNLQLWAVYTSPLLEDPMDPGLAGSIRLMKGRKTRVELAIRSKGLKRSDPAGDQMGVDLLKRVSDLCADAGPVASVYPHTGFWTERVEDGVRLARLVDRKNVGANFNLVHYKWVKPNPPLEPLLKDALPHLMTVTINGLAGDKIVSLDQGDYDLAAFLATLRKVGYTGPVGLQGYGVPGPSEEHLGRSMTTWRELTKKV